MVKLSIAILGVICVATISVAVLIFPEKVTTVSFWSNISWLLILVFLNWAASTLIFFFAQGDEDSPLMGALPGINIIVFIYSLISASLLIFSWGISDFGVLPNWHLVLQIIAFSLTLLIVLFSLIAVKGASPPRKPEGLLDKKDLLYKFEIIVDFAQKEGPDIAKLFKDTHEIIKYSMPHLSKLRSVESYIALCTTVEELVEDISVNGKNLDLEKIAAEFKMQAKKC